MVPIPWQVLLADEDPIGDGPICAEDLGMTQAEFDSEIEEIIRCRFAKMIRSGEVVEVSPGFYKRV